MRAVDIRYEELVAPAMRLVTLKYHWKPCGREPPVPTAKVAALLTGEVASNRGAIGTAEVIDAVGAILADVNLPIGICDFVDDHHAGTPFL